MKFIKTYNIFESKERKQYMYQVADILADIFDEYDIVKLNNDNFYSDYNHYQFNDYSFRIFIPTSTPDNTIFPDLNKSNEIFNKILSMKDRIENITDMGFNIYRTGTQAYSSNTTIYIKPQLESIKESNETDDVNDIMMMVSDFSEEYDWMEADAQTNGDSPHVRFYKNGYGRGNVNLEICYGKMKQILSQFPEYEINSCFFRYEERTKKEDRSTEIKRKLVCLFKYGSDLKEYVNMKKKTDGKLENLITDKVDNVLNYKYKPYEMLIFKLSKKKKETLVDRFKGLFR